MIKINRFRPEDYWLIAVSCIGVLFTGLFFYVGVMQLRILCGIIGFGSLAFVTYIIRRSYSVRRAQVHVFASLLASVALAYGIFALTN